MQYQPAPPVFRPQDPGAGERDPYQPPENPCVRLRTERKTHRPCSGPSGWRMRPCRGCFSAERGRPPPAPCRCVPSWGTGEGPWGWGTDYSGTPLLRCPSSIYKEHTVRPRDGVGTPDLRPVPPPPPGAQSLPDLPKFLRLHLPSSFCLPPKANIEGQFASDPCWPLCKPWKPQPRVANWWLRERLIE